MDDYNKLLLTKKHLIDSKVIIGTPILRIDGAKASLTKHMGREKLISAGIDLIDNNNINKEHLGRKWITSKLKR